MSSAVKFSPLSEENQKEDSIVVEYESDLEDEKVDKAVVVDGSLDRVVLLWMSVNLLATVAIVFTNKRVFSDPKFQAMPLSFAAFHFFCTSATLFVMQSLGKFEPKFIGIMEIMPLCLVFCGNVIFPNLSLAFSTIAFYQIVRILVTPATAILNNILYGIKISKDQILSTALICFGVFLTSSSGLSSNVEKSTSLYGIIFGFIGLIMSASYVIWIGKYFKEYSVSSLQLLYNQAPISVLLLLICIPFNDRMPQWDEVSVDSIYYVFLSGIFAILINVSQFYIVQGTSALTSTVVGHLKTCSIISLGWMLGSSMSGLGLSGVALAVVGIVYYSMATYGRKK